MAGKSRLEGGAILDRITLTRKLPLYGRGASLYPIEKGKGIDEVFVKA